MSTRLPGHGLVAEGAAFVRAGVRAYRSNDPGMALCECGTYSPPLPNRSQRQRWHRQHKDEIREVEAR